jgi:RNA polymerase sigma-70 factor (ECF subfamily)
MDAARPQIDPEELLANAGWLHALARSLVADGHRADDVVQQTFAAAVEHPPGDGVPLRPWLARVARNFSLKVLRSEGRRAHHETQAPAPPPTTSPAESVARAETFREVVNAVLALEPIYRDVVIARFFDGLELTAVATRLGVPVETARTRLKRALAMLRERLDRKYGDRKVWAALLFGGRRAAPTAAGAGGAVVAWKIVAAAAVALVVAGGWYAAGSNNASSSASSSNIKSSDPIPLHSVVTSANTSSIPSYHAVPRSRAASPIGDVGAGTDGAPTKGATLVVRVTDAETHRPIPGAAAAVDHVQTKADAAGVAQLTWTARFGAPLTVEAPGHLYEMVIVDGATTSVDVALKPAATLEVRTVDAAGAVVPNVGFTYEILGETGFGMFATFADGRSQLPVRPNVAMAVRVSANNSHNAKTSSAVWTGPVGAPPVTVTLVVVPEARLVGVVRDADGNPDNEATVRAMPSDADPPTFDRARGGLEGWINDEGRYVVAGLVRGRSYDVVASDSRHAQQRWAPSVVEKVVVPDVETDVSRDFALRRCARLVVRVTGPDGELVPDATVRNVERTGTRITVDSVQPQSPGVFVWPAFLPGEASLLAMAPGQSPCNRIVEVPADGTTEITMQVGAPPSVFAGVVLDETGSAVAGAKVSARILPMRQQGINVENDTASDDAGRFRGSVFGDGPLVLDAAAPGHLALRGLELAGPSEDVRIVMRRAAAVAFRVVADDDAPRIGTIRLLFGGSTHVDTVYTDAANAVRVEKEPRGETEMRLYVEGFAPVVRRVRLDAGAVSELGEIHLVETATMHGRVIDAADRPVANASVRLDMGDDDLKLKSVRIGADGAFTADLAPPSGPLPLRVEAPGFLTLRSTVTIDGDAPVTLRLARGGVVWGEVVDASGAPVPGARVSVAAPDGATTTADVDDCGLFGVRVAAGRCTVSAGGATTTADVADGGEARVRVVVPSR